MTMQTREDAITWLRAQGLYAQARDWSFGASIVASSEVERVPLKTDETQAHPQEGAREEAQLVTVLRNIICIHPEADHWRVTDLSGEKPVSATYATLEEATHAAAAALLGGKQASVH